MSGREKDPIWHEDFVRLYREGRFKPGRYEVRKRLQQPVGEYDSYVEWRTITDPDVDAVADLERTMGAPPGGLRHLFDGGGNAAIEKLFGSVGRG